jgi:putative membrane protein
MAATTPVSIEQRADPRYAVFLGAFATIVFIWSAIRPHDYFTWFLETVPAMIAAVILVATYKRFPLTPLLYTLIAIHACILFVGGHYTYAEVPLFNWIRDHFHQSRNNYDKIGHFAQGFVPAIVAREILIRRKVVARRSWTAFLVISICLAISAAYELFEYATAVFSGAASDAFLGTQGDPWDTQKDMLTALIGASVAILTLSRIHDHQMAKMEQR